jgi:hypothetical protein
MSDIPNDAATADNKSSPITKKLLNLPGQSVDAKLQDFVTDHFLLPLMMVCMLSILCLTEWIGYLTHGSRNPWGFSAMLIATIAIYGVGLRKNWAHLKALKLGRDGERAMAEYMNARLDPTACVLHDVPIAHGNADHVIICTRGIYVVETKTRSKPLRRGAVVSVTSDCLKVDGWKPDRDPIAQARTAATDVHQILKTFTKNALWVTPVVVFPGWSVADHRESRSCPWVLSAENLADRIALEPESLSALAVARLSRHFTRYIRASK